MRRLTNGFPFSSVTKRCFRRFPSGVQEAFSQNRYGFFCNYAQNLRYVSIFCRQQTLRTTFQFATGAIYYKQTFLFAQYKFCSNDNLPQTDDNKKNAENYAQYLVCRIAGDKSACHGGSNGGHGKPAYAFCLNQPVFRMQNQRNDAHRHETDKIRRLYSLLRNVEKTQKRHK